ncbi:DNA-binding GntR family transcriptional regulator [Geodermatophilus tzadiensis]|uniref:DNA-binding GntR family transcriptional regulator n=1 Tax=Geodermatophilus tzadiensis TaxID=1137988 RepID=A0A2T0TQS3_9ACTN|nr:GntR family transcriptional regulator [Geodermatophilus tzadiensis]PRY48007.1 DNA-binding GntR family transcriptional regulator [Geodermatophilus tzadiensis]
MTGTGAHLLRGVQARRVVEQRLREDITRGAVVPGQRLVEPELGERYGVTRNSARLALDVLIAEGLVERIPHRGARVRVVSPSEAVAILECRQVLDGLLARKAAQNATVGEVDRLRATLERMRRAVADQEVLVYSALVQEHHRLLRESARQPMASSLVEGLQSRIARHQFRFLLRPGRARQSLDGLARVVDAVAERRADAAESAARAHLQAVIDAVLQESTER